MPRSRRKADFLLTSFASHPHGSLIEGTLPVSNAHIHLYSGGLRGKRRFFRARQRLAQQGTAVDWSGESGGHAR